MKSRKIFAFILFAAFASFNAFAIYKISDNLMMVIVNIIGLCAWLYNAMFVWFDKEY